MSRAFVSGMRAKYCGLYLALRLIVGAVTTRATKLCNTFLLVVKANIEENMWTKFKKLSKIGVFFIVRRFDLEQNVWTKFKKYFFVRSFHCFVLY